MEPWRAVDAPNGGVEAQVETWKLRMEPWSVYTSGRRFERKRSNPDPLQRKRSDPDPHQSDKANLKPHQRNADPQPVLRIRIRDPGSRIPRQYF
jgi:hypothetical protein